MTAPNNLPKAHALPRHHRAALMTLWLTLFLDLMGFAIILPVLPYYAEEFGASETEVALLSTAYSLAQFVASPYLGRISDRYGRRPVMLISIAGSACAMTVLGFANVLWIVFAARTIAGLCNSNISTAHAYVADIVPAERRAKYMGMVGSAIGLGFVVGPAIGGLLSIDSMPQLPFLVAAGLAVANWCMAFFFLPEPPVKRVPRVAHRGRLATLKNFRSDPRLLIVVATFGFYVAFAAMESTYALVMKAKFGWGARETGTMFAFIGVAIVITQGGLVGRFVERWGERVTLIIGFVALAIALVTIGFAHSVALVAVGSVGIALGNGLVGPNVSALVSRFSSAEEQGESLGVNASSASLGRILGPIAAGPALQFLPHEAAPMAIGAAVVVLVALPAAAAVPPRGRD